MVFNLPLASTLKLLCYSEPILLISFDKNQESNIFLESPLTLANVWLQVIFVSLSDIFGVVCFSEALGYQFS